MRSCKKKDDNKCVCSVLVDSCVTRWISEVCRIEVRRGYGTTQPHQLSFETSSCLRTYLIGLCIICPSFFLTLPNRKASPNGISVAKIPHTCYFNVTILPYALKIFVFWQSEEHFESFSRCTQRTYENLTQGNLESVV